MTIKKSLEGFDMTNKTAAEQMMDFSKSRLKNPDWADVTPNQGKFGHSDLTGSDFRHIVQ
jgi:uncharacterized protein YjbI with pentapeptide repeats